MVNGRERDTGVDRRDCLLLMPCGGMKRDVASFADQLYTGPRWQTFRAKVGETPERGDNEAYGFGLRILSAKHGFVAPSAMLDPYDQALTPERADEFIAAIARQWGASPTPAVDRTEADRDVQIVGGAQYRRVMRAWVALEIKQGGIARDASVREIGGEIGDQRHELGAYLESLPAAGLSAQSALAQHNADAHYVDLAAASMTDAQVMAVAQILGINGRRSVPMQRTLIVTRDSLAARAAIEQVLAQAPSTPDAAPDFELNAQTSEELRARAASNAAADKNDADEQRRLDAKARADAGVGDFVLTGSDRAADVGAANGQQDIFAAPPAAAQAAPQIDLSDAQAFANDYAAFAGRDVAQSVPLDRNTQAVLRMDAAQALRELDARASALDALKLCIGGRA